MNEDEPIHIYIPGLPDDPRRRPDIPDGTEAHYGPPLHPDDVTILDGIPVTSPSRTLIDLAEVMDAEELRGCFAAARERGLLPMNLPPRGRAWNGDPLLPCLTRSARNSSEIPGE